MRICLDISAAVHHRAGLGRMAHELTAALLAVAPEHEYIGFYNAAGQAGPAPPLAALPRQTTHLNNKPWRFSVLLAHFLRRPQEKQIGQTDIFHALDHLLPYLPRTPAVFSLGDLTFLSHAQTHSVMNRSYLKLMMPRFLRLARAVTTISQATLDEMAHRYPLIAHKARVIHLGVNGRFHPVKDPVQLHKVRTQYNLPPRFLLYVGTIEPRKNLPTLLRAFKEAKLQDVQLVIAGKQGWLSQQTMAQVDALALKEDVFFPGYIDEKDLPALYSLAEAFVYPSLHEGFGLPVLEAMASGTAVICSNISSLPEVAGDAALMVDPLDSQALAEAVQQLLQNPRLQAAMQTKGLAQAAKFTWEQTARETLALYQELIS